MLNIPLTKYGAAAGLLVALFAYTVAVWQIRGWVASEPKAPQPDTVTVSEPLAPSDLLGATTPGQVTEYDTSETRTDCIEVPTWLSRSVTSESQPRTGQATSADTAGAWLSPQGTRSVLFSERSDGPSFVTIPTTSGSPRLSVGSDEVQLQGYLPDSGAGREWTYDIPQDQWGAGLRGDLTAGPWLHARSTVDITRYTTLGPLDVEARLGAGYGALVTDEYRAGPVVTAGIRIGYDW